MTFRNPQFFWLLVFIAPMVWLYVWRERGRRPAVRFSDLSVLKALPVSPYTWLRHILPAMRVAGFCFLVVALARPQKHNIEVEVTTEGVDIMLILDISESMKALDFKPDNRLVVAKRAIREFVTKREYDRMGLVLFAARAFTRCPLTTDYSVLLQMIDDADFTDFSNQTAIGTAIATAASRLKDSPAKSRVIILLTDGASNAGDIPPLTAAQATGELGMKIYTIGVGKTGKVPFPVEIVNPHNGQKTQRIQMMDSDLNEKELGEIAKMTGGRFFRARNADELNEIYAEIDQMEKTEIKSISHESWSEYFYKWLWTGFLILMAEMILQYTVFKRIP